MTVAKYKNFPPASGRYVMSPTYLVFIVVAMKSRPSRSGAFAADRSGIVVRCFLRRRRPKRPIVREILLQLPAGYDLLFGRPQPT
ncbi:hypothetical protein [Streptomyces sp. NPDC054794]